MAISFYSLLFFRAPKNENNQRKVAVPYSARFLPRSYISVFLSFGGTVDDGEGRIGVLASDCQLTLLVTVIRLAT